MVLGPDLADNAQGFWGPRTATIDWCEQNYRITPYVAEFHNSWSNLVFIAGPALFGLRRCSAWGAPAEYWLCYALLLAVGLGSTWFHSTLRWEGQLFDELPMLYLNAAFFFCVLDTLCPAQGSARIRRGWQRAFVVGMPLVYCAVTTVVYIVHQDYALFELFYGAGVAALTIGCYTISVRARTPTGGVAGKLGPGSACAAMLKPLFRRAVSLYFFGFAIWNCDNNTSLCATRNAVQERLRAHGGTTAVGSALAHLLAILLELHMWWHVLAGIGTYCFIVWNEAHRGYMRGTEARLRSVAAGALPYLEYAEHTASRDVHRHLH